MAAYTAQDSILSAGRIGQAAWAAALAKRVRGFEANQIADKYHAAARAIGLNPDLALAQACEETGWFTSRRWTAQNNPCGLGITSDDVPGHVFRSPEQGILAHLDHLCCYAHTALSCPVPHGQGDSPDFRHHFHDGDPRLSHLQEPPPGRRWAEKPGYVGRILAIVNALLPAGAATPQGGTMATPRIIDVRDKLPTRAGGGSGQRRTQTLGQVLHYSAVDYPADRSMLDILTAEARYHIRTVATPQDPTPPLGEAGLAYHWTVDPVTGDLYLCRDEDAVLWHCGYWGPGGNGTGLAIHVPGGARLAMTPVAVQSLLWLLGRNEAKHGFGRAGLKGHLELSQTSCPGPLMAAVVRPYRAGVLSYTGGASVAETKPNPVIIKDPITGHTVHPDLADTYQFAVHGRPLKPAVGYSDGVIRQLFERAVLEVGPDGAGRDTTATLGHAFLFVAGDRYPEWPGVKPQF